jgi:conjugal transfer pilus assembly protein TraV
MKSISAISVPTTMLAAALAGCANLSGLGGSSDYGCKAPIGVRCDSVSGTYHNAIRNNLPSQRRERGDAPSTAPSDLRALPQPSPSALTTALSLPPGQDERGPGYSPTPLRSQPKTLRLWIKAWEDTDHDLNGESLVWVQVDNGRWLVEHVQRKDREMFVPVRPPRNTTAAKAAAVETSKDAAVPEASSGNASPITSALKALQAQGNSGATN